MAFAPVTADLLGKFQSVARGMLLSQNPASQDTFVIAHRLTNAGGKGISYYKFTPILRSIVGGVGLLTAPAIDSWNGSQVVLRYAQFTGSLQPAVVDVICEDPHSITW